MSAHVVNGAAAAAAIATTVALGVAMGGPAPAPPPTSDRDGSEGPERIVSLSTQADALLFELVSPERIAAITEYSANHDPQAYRFGPVATVSGAGELERVLGLAPDLVIVGTLGDPRPVARLRDAGLSVLALSPPEGLGSFLAAARRIGAAVGEEARAERFATSFRRRMEAVAADVPAQDRPTAMVLSAVGGQLFGGSTGTSHHDVLIAGGAIDAAASRFDGYPQLSAEEVLAIDPDWLVVLAGARTATCSLPGVEVSRACKAGRVAEVPHLDAPGLGMLSAAESLREILHPQASTSAAEDAH